MDYKISQYLYERLRPRDVVLVETEGNKMYAEPSRPGMAAYPCTAQLLCGTFEKLTTQVFKKEIKPGMTTIVLGADIGYFTLPVTSLGEVFEHNDVPIEFIKMDLEGAEVETLEGMSGIIK